MEQKRQKLTEKKKLLEAHSPERWLKRGLAIVTNELGMNILSIQDVSIKEIITIKISDGEIIASTELITKREN